MKKRALFIVGALLLCATIGIGGTLAYLANVSNLKENTFVFDKSKSLIEIELLEPAWDETRTKEYLPGETLPKNPYVNLKTGVDSWVAIRITADDTKDLTTMPEILEIISFENYKTGTAGKTYTAKKDTAGNLYFFYNTKLTSAAPESEKLFTAVKILNKYASGANKDKPIPQDKYGSFQLNIQAWAVQSENPEMTTGWTCEVAMRNAFPDIFPAGLSNI